MTARVTRTLLAALVIGFPCIAATGVMAERSVGVGIIAETDSSDEAEQLLYTLLGQDNAVDRIYTPANASQFFEILRSYRARGVRVHTLLFVGHGDPDNANIPRITLRDDTIGNTEIDLQAMKSTLKRSEAAIVAGRANPAVRQRIEELKQKIAYMESLSDAMAVDARVLLISCGPAASPEGKQFVRNLGELLMAKRGGSIYASERDIAIGSVTSHAQAFDVFLETGAWPSVGDVAVKMAKWWRHKVQPRLDDPRLQTLDALDASTWNVTVTGPPGADQFRWSFAKTRDNVSTSWRIKQTLLGTSDQNKRQYIGQSWDDSYVERRGGSWEYARARGVYAFNQNAICQFAETSFTCEGVQNDFARTARIKIEGSLQSGPPQKASSDASSVTRPPASDPFTGGWNISMSVPNATYRLRWDISREGNRWRLKQTIVGTNNAENQHSVGFSWFGYLDGTADQFTLTSAPTGVATTSSAYFLQNATCSMRSGTVACQGTQWRGGQTHGISFEGRKAAPQ